jgi:DNA methylase
VHIAQPIFTPAGNGLTGQGGNRNIIFRIPTPVFGAGLIENIPDSAILANMTVEGATHYWYQHEPCWYVRKKNAPWFGKAGENSTVWDSASPKFIMGGSDEQKFDHPTQKPVELMRRPILNHTKRGELVYEPFLGSGTTLAAAELTERVCCGMELDPKYVDVIVQRWSDKPVDAPGAKLFISRAVLLTASRTSVPRRGAPWRSL